MSEHTSADRPDTSPADQRARILDAAIEQFAKLGFKGATVRGIAAAAGVSPGLVQHHFSTKEKLREECDRYTLAAFRSVRIDVSSGLGEPGGSDQVSRGAHTLTRLLPYMTRALLEGGSDVTSVWFDATAAEFRQALTHGDFALPPDEDIDAITAVHTAMQLGVSVFLGEIGRYLNADTTAPETLIRLSRARMALADQRITAEMRQEVEQGLQTYLREVGADHRTDHEQEPSEE